MACKKIKFDSTSSAQLALDIAKKQRSKGKAWRRECMYYFCGECLAYHLSSRTPPPEKKKPDPNFKIGRGGRKIPINPNQQTP